MRQTILNFPQQFKKGLKTAENIKLKGDFSNVIVCGMGGSAWYVNVLLSYINDLKIPIYIHRNYGLPVQVDKNSLIIISSYSGNTEEPINAFEQAMKKNLNIVAITKNGKLKRIAEQNNIPVVLLPKDNIQPRSATGYLFSGLIKVLSNSGIIKDKSKEILKMANDLNPLSLEEQGKQLAKKLKNKIPIIYSSDKFKSLARVWKIKFNENSKTMAFWNYFPELNHNELNAYQRPNKNFHVIMLKDKDDHERILKRMEITKQMIKNDVEIIPLQGKTILEKLFNNLILSDWTSYYLALEYGIDPVKIEMVEGLKKRLKPE